MNTLWLYENQALCITLLKKEKIKHQMALSLIMNIDNIIFILNIMYSSVLNQK